MKNEEPGSSPLWEQEQKPEAGEAVGKATALNAPVHRLGFMTGQISVPDDFDKMGAKEIEEMFGGEK